MASCLSVKNVTPFCRLLALDGRLPDLALALELQSPVTVMPMVRKKYKGQCKRARGRARAGEQCKGTAGG